MAIARDANSNGNDTNTSLTFSHTCSGSNRILFVGIATFGGSGGDIVTGVTYNGVGMTRINTLQANGLTPRVYLYYLINPATGANNVVVSCGATSGYIAGIGSSYTGAKQSGVPDAFDSASVASATANSKAITTVADNCWLVGMFCVNNGTSPAGQAGTSIVASDSGSTSNCFIDSNAAKTPPGSFSLGVNWTSSQRSAILVASFAPSVATSTPQNLSLLGVG